MLALTNPMLKRRVSATIFGMALAFLGNCSCAILAADSEDGFRPLFNGKDLTGWQRVNTAESTWSVNDGMLICSGKPIGELRTTRMYQNFVLELEWRHMVPKGNAGVFIWADDITAKGQPFHRSIEVQVLENAYGNTRGYTTHGDIFPIHGAKMTPINGRGGSRAFPIENRSKPSPEWNHYRIECLDGDISLSVNGKLVTRGQDCNPRKGYICLESEGGVVHYRNIRIKELPDTEIDESMIAIADRGYRCLYNGIDLDEWSLHPGIRPHWKTNDWVLQWDGKATADDRSLSSKETFRDPGFIVDFRLGEATGTCVLEIAGVTVSEISRENPHISRYLAKGRGWNRFEGNLRADRITLSLNGNTFLDDVPISRQRSSGPLSITPTGPIDFANIYVRP